MTAIHKIEDVQRFFIQEGYILLSTEYKGAFHKLNYQCPQGHVNNMLWTNFQQGYRCPECVGLKRKTTEQIANFLKDQNYTLFNEYKNVHAKMKCQCPKGHQFEMTWANFKQGHRCPRCREWLGEIKLLNILKSIFPDKIIKHDDNLDFLGRQRVDFSIRELKLALEYDGEQHFKPVRFGMSPEQAKERLKLQQEWDRRKENLCKINRYTLIRFHYKEELSLESVRAKCQLPT